MDKVCKTVHQYNKEPVRDADMAKLLEVAEDYCKVKNYVYARFGGMKSLKKLYPGYTVQNEMTKSGLREQLGMPSVYFYLAVFEALGEIKSQWTRTKSRLSTLVNRNENFTAQEKHYLRFLLKVNNAFEAVLNGVPVSLEESLFQQYELLAGEVDREKMGRYLCRQVRRCHAKPHTVKTEGFAASERAYRYADHGIYLSVKEKRKRIFVPLTDNNSYKSQIYVKLHPDREKVEICIPVQVTVQEHTDFKKHVGLAEGMLVMLTTDEGCEYGERLGEYQTAYADWIQKQTKSYNRNRADNPGRKKYGDQKKRYEERMHSYINQELNRFLKTEKPEVIYIPKLLKPGTGGGINRKMNHTVSLWQRGYIHKRLVQKCRENSVRIVEVMGKDISRQCSCCGETGCRQEKGFVCEHCGYTAKEKINAARNAKMRGRSSL